MKIMKRSGAEALFDREKIAAAVTKASRAASTVPELTEAQIEAIAQKIESDCLRMGRAPSVEEVQEMVETELMRAGAYETAKHYIRYRYDHNLRRSVNTTDDQILSLIECNNEEAKQENSNKNPTVNSVQRDYMAGEVSKDITKRHLLPQEIVEAHEAGIIHFHDMDYYAQHMHNCDLVNLEDMLQNGTVITGTMIEKPHSFSTACNIATQIIAQVASNQYGGQSSPWPTWPPLWTSPARRSWPRCWPTWPSAAVPPTPRWSTRSWRSACGRRSAGACRPSSTRWSP